MEEPISAFVKAMPAPEDLSGFIITLVTSDVDGWYARIVARGWQCEHPPRHNETYQIYHFFLRDPSGYRIEIQRFDREDWDRRARPSRSSSCRRRCH